MDYADKNVVLRALKISLLVCTPHSGETSVVAPLQPLEMAEFRLRVSSSVEPSAMYAKTLAATEVSHRGSEEW